MATNNQSKNQSKNNKEFTFDDFNNLMDGIMVKVLGPYWLAWVENKILKFFDPSFLNTTNVGPNNNYKKNNTNYKNKSKK